MHKKIITVAITALLLLIGGTTLQAQDTSIHSDGQYDDAIIACSDQTQLSAAQIQRFLDSMTLGDFVDILKQNLYQQSHNSAYRLFALSSINEGMKALENRGITRTTTLGEARTRLGIFNKEETTVTYHPFLIGILPAQSTASTMIPKVEINLSQSEQFAGLTLKLEFFVKLIPFIDRITTRQLGILRPQVSQSAIIWPAVGGRITFAGFTLVILAFGPRIKWERA